MRAPATPPASTGPRGYMTLKELQDLCRQGKVPISGKKTDLIKRLADADLKLNTNELRDMMKERGIPCHGRKDELSQGSKVKTTAVSLEKKIDNR